MTEDSTSGAGPTRRELRAARLRAHEEEKRRRAAGKQGKGDKKSKGGDQQGGNAHRQ